MKRVWTHLFLSALSCLILRGAALAQSPDTADFVFRITLDREAIKECSDPFCQFMAACYEKCSDDIRRLAISSQSQEDTSNGHTVYININITHELPLLKKVGKWWNSWFGTSEEQKSISQEDTDGLLEKKIARDISEDKATDIEKNLTSDGIDYQFRSKMQSNNSWLKKFLEAGALEKIDSVARVRDVDYYTEGNLTFCRVFPNSLSYYGFMNKAALKESLTEIYGGRLSVSGQSIFTFRVAPNKADWDYVMESLAEAAFFSIRSIEPSAANTVREDKKEKHHDVERYFFRTTQDGIYLVVVNRKDDSPLSFYLASEGIAFDEKKLLEVFRGNSDSPGVRYNADMENVTFNLATPDSRLNEDDINGCLDAFIEQVAQYCEKPETMHKITKSEAKQ